MNREPLVEDIQNYALNIVDLEPGDCILAFTDGVTEALDVNNVQFQKRGV
jgi:serine phosphatase RsbU (regulator of sigma subunit)